MTLTIDLKKATSGVTNQEAAGYIKTTERRMTDGPEPTLRDRHKAYGNREKEQASMGITYDL